MVEHIPGVDEAQGSSPQLYEVCPEWIVPLERINIHVLVEQEILGSQGGPLAVCFPEAHSRKAFPTQVL